MKNVSTSICIVRVSAAAVCTHVEQLNAFCMISNCDTVRGALLLVTVQK